VEGVAAAVAQCAEAQGVADPLEVVAPTVAVEAVPLAEEVPIRGNLQGTMNVEDPAAHQGMDMVAVATKMLDTTEAQMDMIATMEQVALSSQ
jgi:hypothetical protein